MAKSEWNKIRDEENEDFRVANCAKYCMVYFDPSIKTFKVNRFYCGRFNLCPACMQRRVTHFRKTLKIPGMVFALDLADEDYQGHGLIKKLGLYNYTQFPREDGITTFFLAVTSSNGVSIERYAHRHPILLEDIDDKEFEFICSTPKGRRVTGYATKTVDELNLIFNNKAIDESHTRTLSLTVPCMVVRVTQEKLDDLISQIKIDRIKYPDDYATEDASVTLATICKLNTRILETMLKKELIFPKMKTDLFQFSFPDSLFKTEEKWEQDDIF